MPATTLGMDTQRTETGWQVRYVDGIAYEISDRMARVMSDDDNANRTWSERTTAEAERIASRFGR